MARRFTEVLAAKSDAIAAQNNVIVTVFLCLLVFVFINVRAMGTILLDVAPLAAAVADVLFIRVRDGLEQPPRRQQRRRADRQISLRRRPFQHERLDQRPQ